MWWRTLLSRTVSTCLGMQRRMATFPQKLKLPYTFEAGNKSFVFNVCPASRYDEVADLFEESATSADGVGADEFPTREILMKKITTSQSVCIIEEKETGELAVVSLSYPSPLSRSQHPIYHSSYHINSKSYRKTGLGPMIYSLTAVYAMSQYGYRGILGRTGSTSRSVVGLMNTPTLMMGIIPRCNIVANKGMLDDLVVFSLYGARQTNLTISDTALPSLQKSNVKPFDDITFEPVGMMLSSGTYTLRPGALEDTFKVEQLLREAAESSDGFAIDEFNKHGQFNRKFFQRCHLAVLCDSNQAIVGAALFGLSSIVRTTTPETSQIYIVIDKVHQNKGIGQKLLENMLEVIHSVGYSRIITDVYYYNHKALHICHKLNFMVTASIPDCGYLKNKGYTSSYVLVDSANYSILHLDLLSKL